MNEDVRFLEAIRARPGSAAQRLVYADWLEEQGDPRAGFIRAQCHAARLAPSHPRRLALEAQAHDLLLRHEEDWLGPLLGHVGNWEFHRGLLRSVTVKAETFLAQAEAWLPRLPLLGVHLRKAHGHLAALAACPQLAHLNALYLGDNDLTDDDLRVLVNSPHLHCLTELYLQSNHITEEGLRALAASPRLKRLRELSLAANHFRNSGLRALVRSRRLPSLRHLNLTMTFLGPPEVRILADAPLLGRLHTLILVGNLLPAGCLKTLVQAPGFARLRALLYDMNEGTDADVEALAASPHGKALTVLSLSNNRSLSDGALKALATSTHLQGLRTLTVGPCNLGRAGLAALGRSRTLKALRRLRLAAAEECLKSHVGDLLRGGLVRRLRELSFAGRSISEAGLAALAAHKAPLRLRSVDLRLGPSAASAWEGLLARGTLSQLTQLVVSNLPPTSLQAMLPPDRLPQLCCLRLYGLPLDVAECRDFLASPLMSRLQQLALAPREDEQGQELLQRLGPAAAPALQRLDLNWSLSPEQAQILVAQGAWPQLTYLQVGCFRLGATGMQALASWPLLRQLRFLALQNASFQHIPGLQALAASPHLGPLLRVDLHNGSAAKEVRQALRQRLGGRFSASGRLLPRVVIVGDWGKLLGDDD